MNLIEITKGYEPKQNEQTEQMKSLPDITDKWKQLAKEQAASLELVTEERDKLQVRNQKMNEFILEFQERTHKLKMEKQNLFFENHEMQDEIRKLNDEIHHLTTELSETQKLNQSLQKNNDDLRNRNGLKSRGEQELLEEEIKDVRDQNSKLQIQVNKSSVEAVDEAQKKQKEAEKKARTIEYQFNKAQEEVKTVKKKTDCEIKKLKNEAKEKETFWMIAYMILVLLAVIKNTVFQKDNLYEKNKKIVVFQGVEESPVSKQRLKGFQDSVQGTIPEEDITYYCGDWLRDRAELRMKDYLISHDSADIVFAFNDDMAYGAYQACQQYRIEGKVHLIGVDGFEGESAGLSLVDKGVLDATIQTPDFGGLSYEIARKLLEGNKVEKNIIIQPELILQGGAERKE